MNRLFSILLINIASSIYTKSSPLYSHTLNNYLQNSIEDNLSLADELNYRLPNNTVPSTYDVELFTDVHKSIFNFTGKVKIKLKVVEEDTDTIVVHYRQLRNFKAKLIDSSGKNIDIEPVKLDNVTEFLTIKLANDVKLINSNEYNLVIDYEGDLRKDNGGFYLSQYKNGDKMIYLATTQFESTDARHGFPCYDEPGIKANFTITIKHGSNFTALSNMPIDTNTSDGTYTKSKFKTTPLMSTYLVAFVVSNFEATSLNSTSHPEFVQRVFSRPNAIQDQNFALKTGVKVLDSFENYLHVDYSLPKMDQIAVPDFAAGAMENWGLVTYREEALLYNKTNSTIYSQTSISNIISHEFGHQWFGNLVSPKWWTYLWLNEGFASLFAYLGTNMAYPEWKVMDYFITSEYHSALGADSQARPMTHYVQKPNEIVRLFDVVSYSKAACVLRMMQHVLTEKNFELALTDYLKKMQYKAAVEEDLFESFQKIVNQQKINLPGDIDVIMASWTRQGGYPLLYVERNYNNGSFKITQKGYGGPKDDKRKWWIPYNFATAENSDFSSTDFFGFLKDDFVIVDGPIKNGDWLILNKQLTGYYRVNYDQQNWRIIISELQHNHKNIHTYNRAQLIFDAADFITTKDLDLKTLFKLLSYLQNEEEYAPWNSANKILLGMNRMLGGDKEYESFQYFIKTIITNIYNKLGITDNDKENHFDKYTRLIAIKWACAAGIESCLMKTNLKLKDLVENNNPIEPNLLSSVYCNGLKTANEKEFNYLYDKLMKSEDQAERKLIIGSLGCSENAKLLRKFAESSISKAPEVTLRTQERIIVLQSIYANVRLGLLTAIDFLNDKYNEYAELTPGFGGANPLNVALIELSSLIVNEDQKEKMMKLVQEVKSHPKVDKNLEEIVTKNIKTSLDWIKENRDSIFETVNKFKPRYRLPNNTIPLHYDVNLFTDVHKSLFNFTGQVTITLKAITEPSDNITIHYRQLQIGEPELFDSKGTKIETEFKLNKDMELITIYLSHIDLIPNNTYNLTIKYTGELRSDNGGFYRSKSSTNGNLNYIATTQFESTDARHGFPCYDEPGLKANFTIAIKHGNNYTALSNMPVKGDPVQDGGYLITKFETTPKMSTYLIAIIVSNFEGTSGSLETNKPFVQRVFSRSETINEQKFALDSGLTILDGIEKYLKVGYSLPKMDQVAVPDFAAGAMENWGLVTYREELLLYNPNKSTINTKTSIATTIAHEYGHQWFGNLVSPKWWTYTWLNEGFASLFAYSGSDLAYPDWKLMEYFIVNEYQKALMNDAGKNPRPMTHYVDTPKEIAKLFDVVSYSKAASVIRMVQHALTEEVFRKALTNYLNKMQYQAAEENDLFDAIRITAKEENFKTPVQIKEFMGSWTSQGGYPLLTVDRQYKEGTFSIKQEGFSISPEENKTDDRMWYIPYNYVRSKEANFSETKPDGYLKKEKEIKVQPNEKLSDSEWIILNKQTTGYYRVNYDEQNWKLIISTLKNDHNKIHVYNRAQLLSDSHHLSLVKQMKLDLFFDLLTYLEKEESYPNWAIANIIFNYYNDFLRGQKEYESFQFFLKTVVTKIYEKLGVNEKKEADSHFDKYTRTTVINWACAAEIESCLKNTNQKIKDLVEKNEEIAPNLQTAVYCNGLKKASDNEFNYMYDRLMKSDNQAERQLLMSSLGCTENGEQLKKFVISSISKDNMVTLRPQERINVLRAAYTRGQSGLYASIEFLNDNFEEYAKLTPGFGGANPLDVTIKGMSLTVVNDEQKTKLVELLEKVKSHPDVDKNLTEIAQNNIDKNLKWIHENHESIFSWMNTFKKDRNKDKDKDENKDNSGNHIPISFMTIIISVFLGMRFII